MDKLILMLITLALSSTAIAGYDDQSSSEYDLDTGLYIHGVSSIKEEKSDYSSKSSTYSQTINLFVFNPKDNTYRHLLDKNYGEITSYVVETAFQKSIKKTDKENKTIGSYVYSSGDGKAKNNTDVIQRAINSNIIIETYNSKNKDFTVWKADKLAGKATVLFSYHQPAQWHLDVKNQKIRLVTTGIENKQVRLRIKSYAW